jgi:SAM-dependent methyltransferase
MKEDIISELMLAVVGRYSSRFNQLGKDVKTLGWGSEQQQVFRFLQALRAVDVSGKSVLDIGCGFGDFLSVCIDNNIEISNYEGWDINPDLIRMAQEQHPMASFNVVDLSNLNDVLVVAEIGFMLGVLNLNFKDKYDNLLFSKMMIKKAFCSVSRSLVVDFLSLKKSPDYPAEDFVFYHDPAELLSYALTLTPSVRLFHDYSPNPQKEFMLVLEHV